MSSLRESEQTPEQLRVLAARQSMEKFFSDKLHHFTGEAIPDEILYSDKNINIVANWYDMTSAMEFMDEMIGKHVKSGSQLKVHPIREGKAGKEDEIKLNMFLMTEHNKHGVVKDFQPGISLLYLLLCEGVAFKGDKNEEKKGNNEGRTGRVAPARN